MRSLILDALASTSVILTTSRRLGEPKAKTERPGQSLVHGSRLSSKTQQTPEPSISGGLEWPVKVGGHLLMVVDMNRSTVG